MVVNGTRWLSDRETNKFLPLARPGQAMVPPLFLISTVHWLGCDQQCLMESRSQHVEVSRWGKAIEFMQGREHLGPKMELVVVSFPFLFFFVFFFSWGGDENCSGIYSTVKVKI